MDAGETEEEEKAARIHGGGLDGGMRSLGPRGVLEGNRARLVTEYLYRDAPRKPARECFQNCRMPSPERGRDLSRGDRLTHDPGG